MRMMTKRMDALSAGQDAPVAERIERNGAQCTDCPAPANGSPPAPADGDAARGAEAQPAAATVWGLPRSLRDLGHAIFSVANPVKVGAELLEPGDQRADPTRLNALKAIADWAWGERNASADRKPRRVIWDLPCPPYEPVDPIEPGPQGSEGGDE
jgi:hypothetical protein